MFFNLLFLSYQTDFHFWLDPKTKQKGQENFILPRTVPRLPGPNFRPSLIYRLCQDFGYQIFFVCYLFISDVRSLTMFGITGMEFYLAALYYLYFVVILCYATGFHSLYCHSEEGTTEESVSDGYLPRGVGIDKKVKDYFICYMGRCPKPQFLFTIDAKRNQKHQG